MHHAGVALTAESPRLSRRRDLAPVLGMAAGVGAVHLVLSGRYGFHHDELYLLAAGRHPALGYVDQPPFVALLARGLTAAVGEHLWALRLVAGAAHAALVVVVAAIAAALGGRRRAVIAGRAGGFALMPVFVVAGSASDPCPSSCCGGGRPCWPGPPARWWGPPLVAGRRPVAGSRPRHLPARCPGGGGGGGGPSVGAGGTPPPAAGGGGRAWRSLWSCGSRTWPGRPRTAGRSSTPAPGARAGGDGPAGSWCGSW